LAGAEDQAGIERAFITAMAAALGDEFLDLMGLRGAEDFLDPIVSLAEIAEG